MNQPARQLSLPLAGPVPIEAIAAQRALIDVLILSATVAGKSWKELYVELEIDKGHWSKIISGQNEFPASRLILFMEIVGNDLVLQRLAYQKGKGLHLLESEQQRKMREKDEQIAELQQENRIIRSLIQGKVA